MTRLKFIAAATVGFVALSAAWAGAREAFDTPEWPNVAIDDEAKWPNVKIDDIGFPRVNPRPGFVDPEEVEARIMGRPAPVRSKPSLAKSSEPSAALSDGPDPEVTGSTGATGGAARWPVTQPEKQPSPYVFEGGLRYWYSNGAQNFGFTNGHPLFGNPTSTLDWHGLQAHSGEAFARLDHVPSGWFVKGVVGLGSVTSGRIDDRDFFVNQFEFSDTTSYVKDGNLKYAMFDVGWAYWPTREIRLDFFLGYHYWNEKVTAYGVLCNQTSILGCPAQNVAVIGYDVPVLRYEPTWHAVRLGFGSKVAITDRWSFTGEFVLVPYASLRNKDSHLLRTDLGPSPNVIANSDYALGVETEAFINYAVTPNFEIGAGVRYWGLTARDGNVQFGPSFITGGELNNFDHQRYGVLVQAKGRF